MSDQADCLNLFVFWNTQCARWLEEWGTSSSGSRYLLRMLQSCILSCTASAKFHPREEVNCSSGDISYFSSLRDYNNKQSRFTTSPWVSIDRSFDRSDSTHMSPMLRRWRRDMFVLFCLISIVQQVHPVLKSARARYLQIPSVLLDKHGASDLAIHSVRVVIGLSICYLISSDLWVPPSAESSQTRWWSDYHRGS